MPGVSPEHRPSATGLPGDYPDRTFTGWSSSAYANVFMPARSGHTMSLTMLQRDALEMLANGPNQAGMVVGDNQVHPT
jgi:hypothetical protein